MSGGRSPNGILGSFGLVQILLDPSDLKYGKVIAKGTSGQVYDAFYAGSPCVAKRMKKNLLLLEKEQITDMAREVSLLAGLRHPNIVTFFGICVDSAGRSFSLILQRYPSSLAETLEKEGWNETDPKILHRIARGIQSALNYLHSRRPAILHRDLKPSNVLLDENLHPKLSDFGLSRTLPTLDISERPEEKDVKKKRCLTMHVGTMGFMAPEIRKNEKAQRDSLSGNLGELDISGEQLLAQYGKPADVYSFGILLYCMWAAKVQHTRQQSLDLTKQSNDPHTDLDENHVDRNELKLLQISWRVDAETTPPLSSDVRSLSKDDTDLSLSYQKLVTRIQRFIPPMPPKLFKVVKLCCSDEPFSRPDMSELRTCFGAGNIFLRSLPVEAE